MGLATREEREIKAAASFSRLGFGVCAYSKIEVSSVCNSWALAIFCMGKFLQSVYPVIPYKKKAKD